MESLPVELVLDIFGRLSVRERFRLRSTSRKWERLLDQSLSSMRSLHLLPLADILQDDQRANECLRAVLRLCGKALKRLEYSGAGRRGDDVVKCPTLPPITQAQASLIGKECPNLRELHLRCVEVEAGGVGELVAVAGSLRSLSIDDVFSDRRLGRCEETKPSLDDELAFLLSAARRLEKLSLAGNDLPGHCFRFLSPGLKSICLDRCENLSYHGFQFLVHQAPDLDSLSLNQMGRILGGPRAICLSIGSFTALQRLETLQLRSYYGLSSLHQILGQAPFAPYLQTLDLRHSNQVTPEVLVALGEVCRDLRHLSLAGRYGFVTKIRLAPLASLTHLQSLDITWLHHLTDSDLEALSSMRGLSVLKAHYVAGVSREGMLAFLAAHPFLAYLDWSHGDSKWNDEKSPPTSFLSSLARTVEGRGQELVVKTSYDHSICDQYMNAYLRLHTTADR